MKKNKTMRFASVLMMMTIVSICVISGTFAKYVTSISGTDSARVAKWGFTENGSQITLTDLFKKSYDQNVAGQTDVIAPGTTNSAAFQFAYNTTDNGATAPEVAYTFKVSTEGSEIAEDIKNNTNIQWKLDTGAWGTWDQMIADIEALDGNIAADESKHTPADYYTAGSLPGEFNDNQTHTVSWKWLFDKNETNATDLDSKDTELGNKANLDSVTLKISVTATQLD